MGKNVAISIGINDYYNLPVLNYARQDAEAVRDFLDQDVGFNEIFLLTDTSPNISTPRGPMPSLPTFVNLRRFLRERFDRPFLEQGDNLWFFFAGYGEQHDSHDYLLPMDVDPGDVIGTAIKVNDLTAQLRQSGADNIILFLDACRKRKDQGSEFGREIPKGVVTFYSCSPSESAYEIESLQQGVFTHSLLQGLRLQGSGNCATVERLDQYLKHHVPELCRTHSKGVQTPITAVDTLLKHLLLLPKLATLQDVLALKVDGFLAEAEGNFELAKQIWTQVLVSSPRDSQAINGISRCARNSVVIAEEVEVASASAGERVKIRNNNIVNNNTFEIRYYGDDISTIVNLNQISGEVRNAISQLSDAAESEEPESQKQNSNLCYVHAEMDEYVIVRCLTTLEVMVSGDEVIFQTGPTAQGAKVSVNTDKPLLVQAIAKNNFSVLNNGRIEVDPPSKGDMSRIYFDLRPTHLGEGEIWVVVSQGQMPLLTLSIKPKIVETRIQIRNLMALASVAEGLTSTKLSAEGTINDYPSSSEPLHQLRIIEKRNGNQVTYRYELDSPSLELLREFESKPITSDRQGYVDNLYREIESRWVSNVDDAEAFTEELRAFGGSLFDELFPCELRSLLWEHHPKINSIMVLSTEPFIPWELIHLKQPGQTYLPDETMFLAQMGLVRWLYSCGRFPPQTILIRKGEVRYIIPHYPDTRYRLPQAEKEQKYLEDTFKARPIASNSLDVRSSLQAGSFDLLHFAGHGTAEQGNIANAKLMLEGRIEGNQCIRDYLSVTTVGQFSRLASRRPIVVLNACQIGREGHTLTGISGFAEAFLRGGAGAFVGPLWSVGDYPAKIFTETLYQELVEEQRLSEAVNLAREAAMQAGKSTWLAYAVYGHPNLRVNICSGTNSSAITNSKKLLSESPYTDNLGVKELLAQLQKTIETESELDDTEKAAALAQVKKLAEAGQAPKVGTMQQLAKRATGMLSGLASGMTEGATFVTAWEKVGPVIMTFFGLL